MKQYTPQELGDIFAQIAPDWRPGMLLLSQAPPSSKIGPAICVYLRYSDVVTETTDLEQRYWEVLRRTPVLGAIGVLATINGILSEHRAGHPEIHHQLNERFLAPSLRTKVNQYEPGGPAFAGVFNKLGCLQLIRHLLLYGDSSVESADKNVNGLGELMLLANEFLQPAFQPAPGTNLDLLLQFLPIWDVCNPRELAYTLSRMFTVLTEILPGADPEVQRLASKAGIDTSKIVIDDLPLNDFMSAVFGLFAYGRKMEIPDQAVFDVRQVFSRVGFPPGILEALVTKRALTLSEFAERLSDGQPCTRDAFLNEIRRRAFVSDSLTAFRKFPFLKIDAHRVLILDLQFLVELLTSGAYWSIFDSVPIQWRDTFRELWGRLFELYSVALLADFYPQPSGILMTDVKYETGQVDALLDFGNEVLVFEVKASLLTELAKRGVNETEFLKDFNSKFVQNDKGSPKAVRQLVASCKAVEDGRIHTATTPTRIYPIFVSDEPAVETFFFNTFMNEIFRRSYPMAPPSSRSPQCRSTNSKSSYLMCQRMHLAGQNYSGPDLSKRELEHFLYIRPFTTYPDRRACSRNEIKRFELASTRSGR
jgi:hypothetical protein